MGNDTPSQSEIRQMDKDELSTIVRCENEDVSEAKVAYAFAMLVDRFDGNEHKAFEYQQFGSVEGR